MQVCGDLLCHLQCVVHVHRKTLQTFIIKIKKKRTNNTTEGVMFGPKSCALT